MITLHQSISKTLMKHSMMTLSSLIYHCLPCNLLHFLLPKTQLFVMSANDLKFKDTLRHHLPLLQLQMPDSTKYISTLWAHCTFSYILICMDRFTRWPEAIPISNITAETVTRAFIQGWISHFSVPFTVTTDRGCQFKLVLWNQLMQLLGCKYIRTTSYTTLLLMDSLNVSIISSRPHSKCILIQHTGQILYQLYITGCLHTNLQCTAAELVWFYATKLTGKFFDESKAEAPDLACYVTRLKTMMKPLQAAPVRKQTHTI